MNEAVNTSASPVELLCESASNAATPADQASSETPGAASASASGAPGTGAQNTADQNTGTRNTATQTGERQPDAKKDASQTGQTKENQKNEQPEEAPKSEEELAKAWENLGKNLDVPVNAGLLSSFVKSAREMGLDPEKSQKLIDWQVEWFRQASAELLQKSTETLKKDWGNDFEPNLNKSLEFVALINSRFPNNEFADAIKSYGICNDAAFIKAMHMIAQSVNEDSIARASGALSSTEDDPLEGIRNSMREKGIKI